MQIEILLRALQDKLEFNKTAIAWNDDSKEELQLFSSNAILVQKIITEEFWIENGHDSCMENNSETTLPMNQKNHQKIKCNVIKIPNT